MSRQTGKNSRDRQKEFDRKRRELRSGPASAAISNARSWPIVQAYVPLEESFKVTGFGTAGIVRLRPDGRWMTSYFHISLLDEGIKMMFGKDDTDENENAEFLETVADLAPALTPGPPELAARYIWGAYAMSLEHGFDFDAAMSARYLGIVPLVSGSRKWWLQQLIGPQGLALPGLIQYLEDHPVPEDIPDDKEVVVFTTALFACKDVERVLGELRRMEPEFIDQGQDKNGNTIFGWTREYPKNHWSPLSKLGGRQSLGTVVVRKDELEASCQVLSMESILITKLKRAFGDEIQLKTARWRGTEDLIREQRRGDEGR